MKQNRWIVGVVAFCLTTSLWANPITRSQARQVAKQLVGISDETEVGDADDVSPYYIFSRGRGEGFVIVSGDDATAPILGFTDEGDFDEAQMPPQLRGMLKSWGETIGRAQTVHRRGPARSPMARALPDYKKDWSNVASLLKTHWHQDYPYNMLAPIKDGSRCMTGCVATAGSQVAYFFRKDNPGELQYDTPTYSYGTPVTTSLPKGTPIRWDLMLLKGKGTLQQDSAVARLMYALGTSAWLTYGDGDGLATSGHNNKMAEALRGQFNLDYQYRAKGGETQQEWEELIYANLKSGRPMLYSGCNDDGGHSVVLDGYNKNTGLYHFNFGWGGQGDGWYTVDNETGMNGYKQYQDLVYDITPMEQNMQGVILENKLWHKAPSTVTVELQNNGTLDYRGVYIYMNGTQKRPSKASATDMSNVIESGKRVQLTFTVTPTTKNKVYLFLAGKNQQMLDTLAVEVVSTLADLHLQSLTVEGVGESVVTDDFSFTPVATTDVTVTAQLTNGPKGTYCQPAMQCYLDLYDVASKTWKRQQGPVVNDVVFDEGQTCDAAFVFQNLTVGALYRAYMNPSCSASSTSPIVMSTADSIAYFAVRPDLSGISTVGVAPSAPRYYNLSGQRIERPSKGMAIVREGRRTRKVVIKSSR